jgi:hypothetical protein
MRNTSIIVILKNTLFWDMEIYVETNQIYLFSLRVHFFGCIVNTVLLPIHIHCICLLISVIYLILFKFLDTKLCISVIIYEYFGRTYCLHILPRK